MLLSFCIKTTITRRKAQFDSERSNTTRSTMFKAIIFAALLAFAVAAPEPKPKPGVLAPAVVSPVVSAYSAPYYSTYSSPIVSAYSPYAYAAYPYAYGYQYVY